MPMEHVIAVVEEWRQVPRGTETAVVVQNQTSGELLVAIGPTAPQHLDAPAYALRHLDGRTFRALAPADRLWLRARSDTLRALIWR